MKNSIPILALILLFASSSQTRAARSAGALPPIVFVSRNPVLGPEGERLPGAIPGIGPRDRTAATGGRLLVLEPDGAVRALVDESRLFDAADPSVSWDGEWIAFSGLSSPDSSWRIYEVRADGGSLRAITRTDRAVALSQLGAAGRRFSRYDDVDPCWLPDGRIAFASTRYPAISEVGDHLAPNLFVIERDGTCLHRITSDRSGADEPAVDPVTGRIVYSRWWVNRDRPSNATRDGLTTLDHLALTSDIGNIWQTVSVAPDGGGIKLHAGDPRSREGSICYKPALFPDGRVLTVCATNGSFSPSPGGTGIRVFAPGADSGRFVIGARPASRPSASPATAAPANSAPLPAPPVQPSPPPPYATDPAALPDGRILFAYAPTADEDFGLWVVRLDAPGRRSKGPPPAPERLLDFTGTNELDAAPLVALPLPPVLQDGVEPENDDLPPTEDPETYGGLVKTFRFDCGNVFFNAPVDAPIPDAPRITRGTRIRFFANFQRQNPTGRDPAILIREADLTARGGVHEHDIPADMPIFEQLIDGDGNVVTTPAGKLAHVSGLNFARIGEGTKCVGCHPGHSVLPVPKNFSTAEWFNASTSATVTASSVWAPPAGFAAPCPPERLVDRRARNDSLDVAWVAAGRDGESAVLHWPIPVEVSRFVLYGIRSNLNAGTDLRVESCRITLYRNDMISRRIETGRIPPGGTEVTLAPTVIDSARVEITRSRGRVLRRQVVGLAEIETIARIASE